MRLNRISITQQLQQTNPANLWLLSGLLLVLLPHLLYQPPLLIICTFILLLWRFLYELNIVPLPSRWLRTLLAVGSFITIAYIYHTIFGRNAGVALLVIMLCLKLLEMRSSRDFTVVIYLGYFVVITGFLFNQSIVIGFYMMAVVYLLTTALIAHHQTNPQPSPQAYTPDSTKGNILTNTTDTTKNKPKNRSAQIALTLLLQAIPLTLLLFFLFPRVPGPLWGLPEDAFDAKTGLSDSMTPGQFTELAYDTSPAFRVTFSNDVPAPSKLYWRGPVFTHFDGFTWQELRHSTKRYFSGKWASETIPLPQVNEASTVEYTVTLEASNRNWLLALDLPTKLPKQSYLTANYELLATEAVKTAHRYQLTSHTDYKLGAHEYPNHHDYQQLPDFAAPKARQLVDQWLSQINDQNNDDEENYDEKFVQLVLNYFRTEPFYYTRNPPLMINRPVDQFLFDAKRGYCEHYASAFVVLMRAAGLPARVVTGYQGGEFNSVGDYFIVRQSDAHAWAEVWLTDKGWTRVDPTAVIPPNRIEQTALRERLQRTSTGTNFDIGWLRKSWKNLQYSWDSVNHLWNQWIIGYNTSKQFSFLQALGLDALSWSGLAIALFGSIAVLLAIIGYYIVRGTRIKSNPARRLYERFCRKLAKKGLVRRPSESAQHFAHRVSLVRQDLAPQVSQITRLYNHLRYTKTPAHDTLHNLKHQIRHFKP